MNNTTPTHPVDVQYQPAIDTAILLRCLKGQVTALQKQREAIDQQCRALGQLIASLEVDIEQETN